MERIKLYIENNEVDLQEGVDFPLTKTWNYIENPSEYINDYSKTIKLPRTKNNDSLFGNIFDLNHVSQVRDVFNLLSVESVVGGTYLGNTFTTTLPVSTSNRMRIEILDSMSDVINISTFDITSNAYTFTKTNMMYYLRFSFESSVPMRHSVTFNVSSLTNNQEYTLGYSVSMNAQLWRVAFAGLKTLEPNEGLYFNPTRKAYYKLVHNGEVINEGYARINVINDSRGEKNYEVTLFGKMGEVFNELKKYTFNESIAEDTKYVIKKPIEDISIDRTTVANSFNVPQKVVDIEEDTTYTDWCGFFPQNRGLYNDFDSKQVEIDNEVKSFVDILPFDETIGNSIVFDGLNEQCYRELRSYYQKPYVYVNKLIQLLLKHYEINNPDTHIELDKSFFNTSNPYWRDLVYCCDYLPIEDKDRELNLYRNKVYSGTTIHDIPNVALVNADDNTVVNVENDVISENIPPLRYNEYELEISDGRKYTYKTEMKMTHWLPVRHVVGGLVATSHRINPDNDMIIVVGIWDYDNNRWLQYQDYQLSTLTKESESYFFTYNDTHDLYYQFQTTIPLTFSIIPPFNGKIGLRVSTQWVSDTYKADYREGGLWLHDNFSKTTPSFYSLNFTDYETLTQVELRNARSYSKVNIKDLVGTDFNFYDLFIKYLKAFGLCVDYDVRTKTMRICTRNTYFRDYSVEDWSGKIDRNQSFQITPVVFDTKYIAFDYEDVDATYYDKYKTNYVVNYGGLRNNTGFDFNADTTNVLKDGYYSTITSVETCLNWDKLAVGEIKKEYTEELMPTLYKIDGQNKKDVELKGNWAFRNPLNKDFNVKLRRVRITDDSATMINNNTYTYIGNSEQGGWVYPYSIEQYQYPDINTISSEFEGVRYGCLWNEPAEIYAPIDYQVSNVRYIYDVAWRNYINERYYNQNKLITAWFNLSYDDYFMFKHNKFVSIANRIYFVNKIMNYNVNNDDLTQVELIQVNDIDAYTSGQLYPSVEYMTIFNPNLQITSDIDNDTFVIEGNNFPISFVDTPDYLDIEEVGVVGNTHLYQVFGNEEYKGREVRFAEIKITDKYGLEYQISVLQKPEYLNVSSNYVFLGRAIGSKDVVSIRSSHPMTFNDTFLPTWLKITKVVDTQRPLWQSWTFETIEQNTTGHNRAFTLNISNEYEDASIEIVQSSSVVNG